jgi:uncharacterized protein YbjT (DUF2867 family)
MRIVVIGGTGLIGRRLVELLRDAGQDVAPAAPSTGVDTLTGTGLPEALTGADVVVDVSNSPSFADEPVMAFFTTSTGNLLAAEAAAGVRHHVALSVVGADRMPDSGYMRAKIAQERLIEQSGLPYTILRATQFFEFLAAMADAATHGDTVGAAATALQPVAAADVSAALADIAVASPRKGREEVAGPVRRPMADFLTRLLAEQGDSRQVVTDPDAGYFGARVDDSTLVPAGEARIAGTDLDTWLGRHATAR